MSEGRSSREHNPRSGRRAVVSLRRTWPLCPCVITVSGTSPLYRITHRSHNGHGVHHPVADVSGNLSKVQITHGAPCRKLGQRRPAWDAKRREAYANDQDAATSLVAVTARTNRQKADQDPAAWMPPASNATCRYLAEWTATKLRWGLSADQSEIDVINVYAGGPCEMTVVHYTPAS